MSFVSEQQRKWFFANYGDVAQGTVTGVVLSGSKPSVTPRMLRDLTDWYAQKNGVQGAERGEMQAIVEGNIRRFREHGLPKNFSLEKFEAELTSIRRAQDRRMGG